MTHAKAIATKWLVDALRYVAVMTQIGRDAEWHFKVGYDPQIALDALAAYDAALAMEEPAAAWLRDRLSQAVKPQGG